MTKGSGGSSARRGLSAIWEEHTRSFNPDTYVGEFHPKMVLPTVLLPSLLVLAMHYFPPAREFTGLGHPWIPITILAVAGTITTIQWIFWDRQRLVHVLLLFDQSLYCLAIVAVMVDTISPTRYIWGLLYAQAAAHYGNRYSFSWPLVLSISVLPSLATLIFARDDLGLLALAVFGGFMFVINSSTTTRVRKVEREKERYRFAYEISDKVATQSLDIALATSVAEFGHLAHELRNTATPAVGNFLMLKEADLRPEVRQSVESLERSFNRSWELIEKMVTSIKRRAVAQVDGFMLGEVLDPDSLGKGLAPGDKRRLELAVGEILPFEINGNPEHLSAALGNLLQNALNAGARTVTVSASLDGSLKRAIIQVTDDGPGIPEDRVESLFLPGAKSDKGESHGLGLPISKRLIEILGGRLRVAKTSPSGTTFEIIVSGSYPTEEPAVAAGGR